jgi:hypothetical protein
LFKHGYGITGFTQLVSAGEPGGTGTDDRYLLFRVFYFCPVIYSIRIVIGQEPFNGVYVDASAELLPVALDFTGVRAHSTADSGKGGGIQYQFPGIGEFAFSG